MWISNDGLVAYMCVTLIVVGSIPSWEMKYVFDISSFFGNGSVLTVYSQVPLPSLLCAGHREKFFEERVQANWYM